MNSPPSSSTSACTPAPVPALTMPQLLATRAALRQSLQRYERITATCQHCQHFERGRCQQYGGVTPPPDIQTTPESCDGWTHDAIPF